MKRFLGPAIQLGFPIQFTDISTCMPSRRVQPE